MTSSTAEGDDALERILADPALLYRFVVEESSDVLAIHDPGGRMRWISPSIQRMAGWTAEERLSGASGSMIHPDDIPAVLAVNQALHEGSESGSARIRLLHKDGREVWALSTARAWRDAEGAIVALAIVTHDIDDVVRAEEERRDVETLYRLLAENANDVVLETVDGVIRWVSPSVTPVLGWRPEQLVGRPAWEFMHPDDIKPVRDDAARVSAGLAMSGRTRALTADGAYRWMARTQRPVLAADGSVVSHATGLRDVHEQVRAEQAQRESEAHYRLLAEQAADFTLRTDADDVIRWVSPSVERVMGWRPEEVVGRTTLDFVDPGQRAAGLEGMALLRAGEIFSDRALVRRADGRYVWLSQVASPVLDENGDYAGHVGGYQDVDAAVRAQKALEASEERFRLAMTVAPAGMAITDLDRRLVTVNPALCRMLDRDEAWLLAHRMSDVLHPDDDGADLHLRAALLGGGEPSGSTEMRLLAADGHEVWAQHGLVLLHDTDGEPTGFLSHLVDITESRAAREELERLATLDPLTGLLNRTALLERLSLMLAHPARGGLPPAVLFLDVDNLKRVNDSLGHRAGDTLITTVTSRARSALRADDLFARHGGDEFVAVLAGVTSYDDALLVADKVHATVSPPFEVKGETVRPTVSIGVAVARPGQTAEQLLEEADHAMFAAKRAGGHGTARSEA